MQGVFWLAEELLASQEGFCSMQLVFKQKTDISPEDSTNKQNHAMGMNKWKNFSHISLCATEHIPENYNVLFLSHGDLWLWSSAPVGLGHHNFYYIYCTPSSSDVSLFTLLSPVTNAEQCCCIHTLQKTHSTGVTTLHSRYVYPSWYREEGGSADGWPGWQQGEDRIRRRQAINTAAWRLLRTDTSAVHGSSSDMSVVLPQILTGSSCTLSNHRF